MYSVSDTDGDRDADDHHAGLSPGVNTVTITAEGTIAEKVYTLTIGRGVTDAYEWKAVDDLDGLIAAGNEGPTGIWGDGSRPSG